jgi:hypothetical protein
LELANLPVKFTRQPMRHESALSVSRRRTDRKLSTIDGPWHEAVETFKVALGAQVEIPIGGRSIQNHINGIVSVVPAEILLLALNLSCSEP